MDKKTIEFEIAKVQSTESSICLFVRPIFCSCIEIFYNMRRNLLAVNLRTARITLAKQGRMVFSLSVLP